MEHAETHIKGLSVHGRFYDYKSKTLILAIATR